MRTQSSPRHNIFSTPTAPSVQKYCQSFPTLKFGILHFLVTRQGCPSLRSTLHPLFQTFLSNSVVQFPPSFNLFSQALAHGFVLEEFWDEIWNLWRKLVLRIFQVRTFCCFVFSSYKGTSVSDQRMEAIEGTSENTSVRKLRANLLGPGRYAVCEQKPGVQPEINSTSCPPHMGFTVRVTTQRA